MRCEGNSRVVTEALRQPADLGAEPVPVPGRIDRLIGIPVRLPGPTLLWDAAIVPIEAVILSIPPWVAGGLAFGSVSEDFLPPAVLTAYFLALIHVLNRVARASFEDFRPALGPHAQHAKLAASMTSTPDRPAVIAIAIAEVLITIGFLSNGGQRDRLRLLPPSLAVAEFVAWWIAIAVIALAVLHIVRQLRLVNRLHGEATVIDLFDPSAIIAFSRFTSSTAIGLLVVPILSIGSASLQPTTSPTVFDLAQQVALVLLAITAFVLPLLGMHDRMAKEKGRLLREVNERLKGTTARIHQGVDADRLAEADQLNKTLNSLLSERDVVGRFSTWPWSPNTLRGFGSAILLPLVIWLLIRVLERVI